MGTKAGRIARVVRLFRLIRIVKLYKATLQSMEKDAGRERFKNQMQDDNSQHNMLMHGGTIKIKEMTAQDTTMDKKAKALSMVMQLQDLDEKDQGESIVG